MPIIYVTSTLPPSYLNQPIKYIKITILDVRSIFFIIKGKTTITVQGNTEIENIPCSQNSFI